uniref:Uncharacterized protein n=1 Tax=Prymnesium polylepis TaxID=72548 RepID=A0A7S4MIV7_9EUKA
MATNRTTAKWRRTANNIDRWCRKWIPILYFIALFVIYMLKFDDHYGDEATPKHTKLAGMTTHIQWPANFWGALGWLCEIMLPLLYFWFAVGIFKVVYTWVMWSLNEAHKRSVQAAKDVGAAIGDKTVLVGGAQKKPSMTENV